jgi:hypothetical protein
MEKPYQLTFPMFGLLLKDGTGTILLRRGQDLIIPLFTEDTNVLTYASKGQLGECIACELPAPDDVAAFIRNPPRRTAGALPVNAIILDPVDNEARQLLHWTVESFLHLLNLHSGESSDNGARQP